MSVYDRLHARGIVLTSVRPRADAFTPYLLARQLLRPRHGGETTIEVPLTGFGTPDVVPEFVGRPDAPVAECVIGIGDDGRNADGAMAPGASERSVPPS